MPVEYNEKHAVRVIKGDVNGTPSRSGDWQGTGNDINVEFTRIYKGADLKFDKWAEDWLCIHNPGSSNITVSIAKWGSTWSSDIVLDIVTVTAAGSMSQAQQTFTASSGYTSNSRLVYAGGKMYIRNANSSQEYISESQDNYINIKSSASHYVTGNWLALAPGARTSGTLSQYAFYRLFYGNTGLTSAPDFTNSFGGYLMHAGNGALMQMFYGCTGLTNLPALSFDTEGSQHVFDSTFYGCTGATSCGDITATHIADSAFASAYYNCTSLTTGPSISSLFSGGYDVGPTGLYRTFRRCTAMTSLRGLKILSIEESGMRETFYGCSAFTGSGLEGEKYNISPPGILTVTKCTDIYLKGSYALKDCFYGCTSLNMAFGAYSDPMSTSETIVIFQFVYSDTLYTHRMDGTFKNSGLSQNSFGSIRLGDVMHSGDKQWHDYDLYQTFYGCTAITNATNLFYTDGLYNEDLATKRISFRTAGNYTFQEMFRGCTSLQYAKLPQAFQGGSSQMKQMFYGCTSLQKVLGKTPPNTSNMHTSMFEGCTSLVLPPIIANSSTNTGFSRMFYGCSSLKYIITGQGGFLNNSANTLDWTYGTTNGTDSSKRYFVNLNSSYDYTSSDWNTSGNTTANKTYSIPYGWTIINHPLTFMGEGGNVSVKLYKYGSPAGTHVFTYLNLGTSVTATYTPSSSPATISSSVGVLFWGTSTNGQLSSSNSNYFNFLVTGSSSVSGDIRSLHKTSNSLITPQSHCYYRLFYNSTGIVDASNVEGITGTAMEGYKFSEMFRNCTGLTAPPVLSVNAGSTQYAMYRMFEGCTSLVDPPSLSSCSSSSARGTAGTFAYMFWNCTSLTEVADLPSVTDCPVHQEMFYGMYQGCTSLAAVPSGYLPWTSTAQSCYQYMFAGCTSLVSVPNDLLPSGTLTYLCYANMFEGSTSLASGPDLMAANTGAVYPYSRIFSGCTSLSYIKVGFSAWSKADSTHRDTWDWTNSVPTTGSFWCPGTLPQNRNNSTNTGNSVTQSDGCNDTLASFIPYGWTIHTTSASSDWSDTANMLIFARYSGTVSISPTANTSNKLQYTTNGITWAPFTSQLTLSSSVTKIGFRAASKIPVFSTSIRPFTFSGSGRFDVSGNVTRFFNTSQTEETNADCLFYGCQQIRSCTGMYFSSSPITAKEMFMNSAVTSVDRNLLTTHYPAYESGNFFQMFRGCTSLTQGAHLYTATAVLPMDFYNIYYGCTSLLSTAASPIEIGKPSSGATALGIFAPADDFYLKRHKGYYCAFYGCTSIAAAKVNFNYMGKDWNDTNLRRTFEGCFYNCSNLSTIKCKAVRWPLLECTNDWVYGVAGSGTFYKYTGNSLGSQHGRNKIPQGWTVTETTWA